MTDNGHTPIKDLSDAEFEARYSADRYTATVLSNRMRYIVEHMCTNLLHHAFSGILRDWYDFAPPSRARPRRTTPCPRSQIAWCCSPARWSTRCATRWRSSARRTSGRATC